MLLFGGIIMDKKLPFRPKFHLKKFLILWAIVAGVGGLLLLAHHLYMFPLSEQDLQERASEETVLNHVQEGGVWVLVEAQEESFLACIFTRSALFARYQRYGVFCYEAYLPPRSNDAVTSTIIVQGRNNAFMASFWNDEINLFQIETSGWVPSPVLSFALFSFVFANVIYLLREWKHYSRKM